MRSCALKIKTPQHEILSPGTSAESRKMLCYADLGVHVAFDGTEPLLPHARVVFCSRAAARLVVTLEKHGKTPAKEIPLRIIGEIQLILEGYANVKNRFSAHGSSPSALNAAPES